MQRPTQSSGRFGRIAPPVPRLLPVAAAALALVLWTGLSSWIDGLYGDYRLARLHGQTATMGASVAGGLANALNQRLALVRGLAAFVTVKLDDAVEREFPAFAQAIHGTVDGIRNISLCPDFIVREVYPLDPGNLKVLGNDILADKRPGFADAVRRAMERRGLAVHEPVTLIQGGLGLIARHAIYRNDKPWGAVGMVFTIEPLMTAFASGLDEYQWGVRSAAGTLVGGDASVFEQQPEVAQVQLPEGHWDVGLVPRGGWRLAATEGPETAVVRIGLGLAGILIAVAIWESLRRRARLKDLVEERTRELSAANAELARFAYAVAHDLQEPLRTIASFSQLVERDCAAKLDERPHQWLLAVIAAAKRMKDLLADTQLYLAEHELPLPTRPIAADECLEAARERVAGQIADVGADIEAAPLPMVMADRHRLTEVLVVLLSNAIEYRAPERTPSIRVSARSEGGMVAIDVADNGIGIDEAYFDRIFMVFQRLHSRAEHPGTGMGLAIAAKMVERLGGRLTVRSAPGKGSTFTALLPAAKE